MRLWKYLTIVAIGFVSGWSGVWAQEGWFGQAFPEVFRERKAPSSLVEILYDANVICAGNASKLWLDYSLYGTGNLSFEWYEGTVLLGQAETLTYKPGSEGAFDIRVDMKDNGLLVARDTVTIYVTQVPCYRIVHDTVCRGLEATVGVEGGKYWAWSNSGTTSFLNVRPPATKWYKVRISEYPVGVAGYLNACYAEDSAVVVVHDTAVFGIEGHSEICTGLEAEVRVVGGSDVEWNGIPGDEIRRVRVYRDTLLEIKATDRYGCRTLRQWPIRMIDKPTGEIIAYVDGAVSDSVCLGESIRIEVESDQVDHYRWFNNDTNAFTEFTPKTHLTVYCDIALGDGGCKARLEKTIRVKNCSRVYFANGFVPGGYSKYFGPIGKEDTARTYRFFVYDRNGTLFFSTTEFSQGWDGRHKGKIVPPGVYVYVFRESYDRFTWEKKGTFSVIQ